MIIAVDFDGTIVTHEYPKIGRPAEGAIQTLKELLRDGHQLILWTMRSGDTLDAAVDYLKSNGITLYGINSNPNQHWSSSPKAYAHLYIDDAALGCPVTPDSGSGRMVVNWYEVRMHLKRDGIITFATPLDSPQE